MQIEGNPSTAYHPETDGQTEWVNAWVEQYLQLYVNHQQTDWSEWLSIAKFAHNQTTSLATNFSLFILNYGQQPRSRYAQMLKHRNPMALEFIEEMKSNQQVAKSALKMAAYDMKHFHDRKVCPPVKYQPGDLVLLEATNIRTKIGRASCRERVFNWV